MKIFSYTFINYVYKEIIKLPLLWMKGKHMNKIWQKYMSMSKGKKIYALLWLITSITLIAFIAVAVSLNTKANTDKVADMSKPYGYEITTRVKPGETLPTYENIVLTDSEVKDGVDKNQYADVISKVHNLKEAINTLHASEIYDLAKVTNNIAVAADTVNNKPAELYYAWGDKGWQETLVPTDSGASAQDGIAASGLVFGIALASSVFTTVGVQVASKRNKGGNK